MGKKRRSGYVIEDVALEKFVNGGQVLGYHNGQPVFVWGALPGEKADVLVTKARKGITEGVVQEIKSASEHRITPKNDYEYLSTSPWQVLSFAYENEVKLELLKQTFKHEAGLDLGNVEMFAGKSEFGYRNKMEYNFWGDEEGIHLALHKRGSGQKIKLEGSVLASEAINGAGQAVVKSLNEVKVFAGDLKSLVIRSNLRGQCVGALFVKKEDFAELELPEGLSGLVCYYSNPQSPASVITKELWRKGEIVLEDEVLGKNFAYDVNSFFQLNIPVFEEAVLGIKRFLKPGKLVDFYGGVGSIGISLADEGVNLEIVELGEHSAQMAKANIKDSSRAKVFNLPAEEALEKIVAESTLVVDPPRAGLHKKVVQKICEVKPKQVVYLSCNPVTQARDLKDIIEAGYEVRFGKGYNFFPRTPHIESLVVLEC